MRFAFLADIHSNLEAFQAVLASCEEQGVDRIYCLGDIVGYGANPKECIDLIKSNQIISVAGNHDWAVCDKIGRTDFNPAAQEAICWTRNILGHNEINFLKELPLTHLEESFVMVHASLNKPRSFLYIHDIKDTADTFYLTQRPVCFIGHTHVPRIYAQTPTHVEYVQSQSAVLNPAYKYIVNAGSVGQPRDGNPAACYSILDAQVNQVEIHRVHYNVEEARRKILEAALPDALARRLLVGH